jgi:copper oxidase (laccase) domain-containing protein
MPNILYLIRRLRQVHGDQLLGASSKQVPSASYDEQRQTQKTDGYMTSSELPYLAWSKMVYMLGS